MKWKTERKHTDHRFVGYVVAWGCKAANYLHLGQLRGSASGDLGHTQVQQLGLELLQLLGQLLLLLLAQFGALDFHLRNSGRKISKTDGFSAALRGKHIRQGYATQGKWILGPMA